MSLILSGTDGLSDVDGSASTPAIRGTDANTGIFFPAADTIAFAEGGAEVVRIDSSGNVGIGTSSPDSKLHVKSTVDNTTNGLTLEYDAGTAYKSRMFVRGNDLYVSSDTGNTGGATLFLNGGTERMRITSAGILMVGGTTNPSATTQRIITTANGGEGVEHITCNETRTGNATETYFNFFRNTVKVGAITNNASSTAYVTSSDYRLKENVAPMTGALAKVSQLKPCTYTWKVNGSAGQGFIAHELAEVVPDAVSGEKDAIETYTDEDGNEQTRIKPQGIDTSFLVATLTAAIQELKAIVDAQAIEIAELKAK